jgi:hypothetical protein
VELPIEQIVDHVSTLRMLYDRSDRERRHLPRFPVWAPAKLSVGEEGAPEPLDVELTNLACGGIGFLSPRPLQPGQRFHVSLPCTDASPLHAVCEVVHCSRSPAGSHLVGARFAATHAADRGSPS